MRRRTFVQSVALASLMSVSTTSLNAKKTNAKIDNSNTLTGKEFFLTIDYTKVNLTDNTAVATTINGQISGPTLVWQEGDTVTRYVTNKLKKISSIHWHGIILPTHMDGVPGLCFAGIPTGKTWV